jgi:hypothetical protein
MTVDEEIVNSIVSKSTGTLETKIRDLQVELTTKFHDEINAQTEALSESFSDFIQTEVSTAVSDSLQELGKESKESLVAGLETRIDEIKNTITREVQAIQKGLEECNVKSIDSLLKINNPTLLQNIVDHLHHPDGAVRKFQTSLGLKVEALDTKLTQNSEDVARVMTRLESLERRHGNMVHAYSQSTEAIRVDVKELETTLPLLPGIEVALNKIYSRILVLEKAVQGGSGIVVEVSRATDNT